MHDAERSELYLPMIVGCLGDSRRVDSIGGNYCANPVCVCGWKWLRTLSDSPFLSLGSLHISSIVRQSDSIAVNLLIIRIRSKGLSDGMRCIFYLKIFRSSFIAE